MDNITNIDTYLIPTMLPINDIVSKTGLSYNYIRTLCMQNRITYVRAGKKYLVNLEKFIEFLNNGDEYGEK